MPIQEKAKRANLVQAPPQTEQDTHIDENGVRQPNPPLVNMLKIVNHIGATSGSQEKNLKFPINVDPRGPYKHHLVVRFDTGADVNCMNEKTFKKLFPEVKLSVCPHEIQNFGNLIADISILGQFHTYLQFRGEKYLNTFIVTNANDCPNLLSHGATFRMGVLLPNYTEENLVKACGENVPNFKYSTSTSTSTGTSSNVFQILQDLWLKQYQENHPDSLQNESRMSQTSTHSTTSTTAQPTTSFRTCRSSTVKNERTTTGTLMQNIVQLTTSFRTTTPTIVDFKKGYWMVVLHPDSRRLTCMALPFGRFQWTRLPMGTVVAQDIFQAKLDAIFIGMEGVTGIADDMIIAGKDEMEHDRNFLAFMEKCMENNLTLNSEKIQFKQSQVSFYGHIWSEHGISPDTKKIQALKHMEFPPDKETMRSFLGIVVFCFKRTKLGIKF